MKIRFVTDKAYQNNRIFNSDDPTRAKYVALRDEFSKHGYELLTNDLIGSESSEFSIFHDLDASYKSKLAPDGNNYALLIESPLIRLHNYREENHSDFKKVFTWNDDLVGRNDRYVKINYSFPSELFKRSDIPNKSKLCVLIVSNKRSRRPNELYSCRRDLIRWFENNASDDFDLYGRGWEEFVSSFKMVNRVKKRFSLLSKCLNAAFFEPFPSYGGAVDNKLEVQSRYRFSVSFENFRNEPGYITEKIFDSFFSNCVPIYLGAKNILDHIPAECFIDMRKFKSFEVLYKYISEMPEKEYLRYLYAIQDFLENDGKLKFSTEAFADTVVSSILRSRGELP